ncbi:Calcipressin-domain-containing protein [Pyronema domesticum]|uniref:Similar to Calcipressin-2 acc. no. Q4R4P5 n=1 Tax=Pyronema omphalodes (strain CBS 100304) TaxID=1076935 RepID=U4LAP4_PYROM|nr:Calcipressin-domain-containing protein [Pyronema domesticum]CCX16191.1 Similar to Calcipressin-2; acc. no. Q4R4P5 [Pyronema omphalodes CBS 100304]
MEQSPLAQGNLSPIASPTRSRASSRASHLTLDLSCINNPPPTTPTNTLLITNLNDLSIFSAPHLQSLRDAISLTAAPHSWSPLKSFRRIVCSFSSVDDAIAVRSQLDGTAIMGERIRVYFGEPTPITPVDQHLQAPESKKLFFISPPPSPPHGWESKEEEPPNSVVVAEDLASALAKLNWVTKGDNGDGQESRRGSWMGGRPRSCSSVLLFSPEDGSEEMPAISVDDYTDSGDENSPIEAPRGGAAKYIPEKATIHTARPPVELMEC